MKTAVLVIDVQRGLFDDAPRPFEADDVVERINALTAGARVAGARVARAVSAAEDAPEASALGASPLVVQPNSSAAAATVARAETWALIMLKSSQTLAAANGPLRFPIRNSALRQSLG
jgi:nicotinamidase-related amidase